MALDKAIEHGKERRRPYRRGKAIDHSCRNHGSCAWCQRNRTYFDCKGRARAIDELRGPRPDPNEGAECGPVSD